MKKLIYSLVVVFLLTSGTSVHANAIPTCSVGQSAALDPSGNWYCQTAAAGTPTPIGTVNGISPNSNGFCGADASGKVNCTYTPLEPLPGLPTSFGPNQGTFAGLIANSFKLLLGAGAMIAVVMLVLGALTYMFSDVITDKFKAKERIRNAMWAIVLLVSSYLILNTINPDLVQFKLTLTSSPTSASQTTGTTPIPTTPTAPTTDQISQCQGQSSGNRICTLNASPSGGSVCSCGSV